MGEVVEVGSFDGSPRQRDADGERHADRDHDDDDDREEQTSTERRKPPRSTGNGLVPGPADGPDQGRPPELAPELADVDVHGPRAAGVAHPPHAIEEPVARVHDAGALEEVGEEVELLRRQLDRLVADRHLAALDVDDDVGELDAVVARRRLGATKDRLHAGDELARRERLGDVVVGADLEPGDTVGLLVARGEHENRHCGLRAKPAADLKAVEAGQADVEHDEADRMPRELGERFLTGAHPDHAIAVAAEVRPDDRSDRLLVLDEEHRSARLPCRQVRGLAVRRHFRGNPVTRTRCAGSSPSRTVIA